MPLIKDHRDEMEGTRDVGQAAGTRSAKAGSPEFEDLGKSPESVEERPEPQATLTYAFGRR
jgi:hypothetical protein